VSRSACDRLDDILERIAAAQLAEHRMGVAEVAGDDELAAIALDALIYDLLIIGEAIKALPGRWHAQHPEVLWSDAARMRDVLAHRYFHIRADVVRATVDEPLTVLAAACVSLRTANCG
jgi:uncharacterized protein with HEPN domain